LSVDDPRTKEAQSVSRIFDLWPIPNVLTLYKLRGGEPPARQQVRLRSHFHFALSIPPYWF